MRLVKNTTAVLAATVTALGLAACGSSETQSGSVQTQSGTEASTTEPGGQSFSIAVAQIVTHPSLDASIEGFKAAIADAGLDVKYDDQNANNDQTVVPTIATSVAGSDADLVLAVGTPIAQGLAQAVSDKPILFTAVTDPLGAGLVDSLEKPGKNVTGTSDANPVSEQIELITKVVPGAKTLGVIFNPGEANSQVQVEWVKEAADKLGLTVQEAASVTTADVQQAADSLNVDAIYVPTDNTVVSALDSVLQVGESKKIPVFAAEGDSVEKGALATYGISYYELGYQTGEMAVRILTEGASPADMPVETQADLLLYINQAAAGRMGVTVPEEVIAEAKPENIFE